jgi:hypothetical protein
MTKLLAAGVPTIPRAGALALALLVSIGGAASAGSRATRVGANMVVRVAHGPVTSSEAQYVDAGSPGPSVGDVRTYYLPLTRPGETARIGYLTGTLTTTATGEPRPGMELRSADLVFVVGGASDQLVVGGVSAYSQTAPTVARRSVVTRPVIGGSGRYAGARGWCVTTHFANDTWTHVFHLVLDRP